MLFSQLAEDKGVELIHSSQPDHSRITNTITNNNSLPANSKKFAFLLVLLGEVGYTNLTHKQKLTVVQTCLDGFKKVFDFVLENSYDNSKSAQRNRTKKNKYKTKYSQEQFRLERY